MDLSSMTEKKQLVLVVEGTIDLGSHWQTIVSNYLEKVIRKFCSNEAMDAASSIVELALVQFNAHGSYSPCLVQRSCWARNVHCFLEWLSCMQFGGGGFRDVAIAEGLTEVLTMCPPNGTETQPTEVLQRHCILVAASNPCPLPTVYWPPNKSEMQSESRLFDAETVAKSFPQSCVSLSVICPNQLPKLETIYNAGKRNPSAGIPNIDVVKSPNYLILISEDFTEACVALSPLRTSSPSNMKVTSVSPTSREPISSNDNLQDMKPVLSNIQPPLCPVNVSMLGSLPQARPANPIDLAGGVTRMSNMIVGAAQVAQHTGTMTPTPRMSWPVQGIQSVGSNINMGTNVGISQHTSSTLRYAKMWEGNLGGIRHGQAVMITKLEAYRSSSSAESLAADWPSALQIDRLISQDHMHTKEYYGKCEWIVFRAFNQHGFLGQLQDKKLCAVVRLPSQTLLLSVTDKPFRLIGMLFPADMLVFKYMPSEQQRVGSGTSQGAGGPTPTQLVDVGQGQVSSPCPKPKQELP